MDTDKEKLLKIVTLIKELEPLIQSFDSIKARLEKQQENYDTQHNDAYHTLEVENLNAADSMKWFKYVKGLERDRRENKNTLELAKEIDNIFQQKGKPPVLSQNLGNVVRQCEIKIFMQRVKGEHIKAGKI